MSPHPSHSRTADMQSSNEPTVVLILREGVPKGSMLALPVVVW